MITSWRITSARYRDNAFDGEGTKLYGGRWNSRGVRVVYTSSSAALAALELLVRMGRQKPLTDYLLFACSFDESLAEILDRKQLPANWRTTPPPVELRAVGDAWVHRGSSAVLRVPSAVIETEDNYLMNPEHADFTKIQIREEIPFSLDLRLLRR
ncbi:MAG TPA: RES family NAD+ phosphorylase [Thermoanaerobaculia bacterium]|nr:RES family NAD+ phosphorylase [Thermoanaerobaculia bacterium]